MNVRSILTSLLVVAGTLTASAQTTSTWVNDSVTMTPGYLNDVYYSLRNGISKIQPNIDWHLAFQVTPPVPYGTVGAIANHAQTGVKVHSLHMSASSSFDAVTAADTVGKTSVQLYNSDTNWYYGAFNQMNDPNDPYDYSWGSYQPSNHNIVGDSLYLIKVGANSTPYKLWIKKFVSYPLDSVKWIFRIAQFDGTGDTTFTIKAKDYQSRLFAYYNVTTRTAIDREPDRNTWDFVFTRYVDTASQGSITIPYNTTGALSNVGLAVADVRGVDEDTAAKYFQSYARIKDMNAIGYDWKTFDMSVNPPVWRTDSTINYFIRTATTSEYYQLQFTKFEGSASGKIFFRKRSIVPTSVSNVAANNVAAWYVAPNPATDNISVMVDAKTGASNAKLTILDASGRMVQQMTAPLQKGMNGYSFSTASLPSGMYFVRLGDGTWNVTTRLTVAH